jgi:spore germination protein YaaH
MKQTLSALLIPAALWALLPVAGLASAQPTPVQDSTHPVVMQQAADEVATAKVGSPAPSSAAQAKAPAVAVGGGAGLRREVFGFALGSSLSDPSLGYPSWNFSLLSTVAYFGLHIQDNGTFAPDSGLTVWNSNQLSNLVAVAHGAATKVVLTIILQDFTTGTPHMCAGLANRATTVSQTIAQVAAKGVDGVNLDFEGLAVNCPNGLTASSMMTDLAAQLRQALGPGAYLSVDTYASSAGSTGGFFDVPGLSRSVDSFFVMAYDLERSNYSHPPLNCPSLCLGPTSPLTGYYFNDTNIAAQYVGAVGAGKVILGLPYYGRKACVSAPAPNQLPTTAVSADGYLNATGEAGASGVQPGTYATHRDANDPPGQERWDTWVNTALNCTRELYWDDTVSLGLKYDLVNNDGLRGVGIWNLNFGGGAPELWNELAVKFGTASPYYSLGGVVTSGADASSWGPNRSDVFVRGTDGAIYHRGTDGAGWGGWESLGGVATSDPAAVAWGSNRIDLFVRGTDLALYHRVWNGIWHPWESLGGVLTSSPAVASWSDNRLDVFVRGTDNALYHRVWNGVWNGWEGLGGSLASDPAAVSWSYNRIDVFTRNPDATLGHKVWDGSRWSTWESLPGGLSSSPAAASCAAGHLDVFVVGTDSALYQLGYAPGGWRPWQRLGGTWNVDPGAVCRPGSNGIDLFERGPDQAEWGTRLAGS